MALTKITRGVIKANENYDTHNINSTGIVTAVSANFTGDVSIGGTLTYQDVTNIDSIGIITARSGLHVTSGSIGIGIDNPLNTLHVKGPTGGVSARFTDAVNATVFVSHPSSGKSKIADAGGNYGFEFDTASVNVLSGGSERLRIHSHGQLELKVPDANPALKITPSGTNAPAAIDFNTPGTGVAKLLVQGTERLRIASDGDIEYRYDDADTDAEVGATQVPHGLRIYNTNNTLGRLAGIHFSHGSAGTANAGIFHETTNTSSTSTTCLGDLAFYTKNSGVSNMTEKLRIASDGALLVGEYGGSSGRFVLFNADQSGGADTTYSKDMGLYVRNDCGPTHVDLTGVDNFTAKIHNGAYSGSGISNPQGTISKLLLHGVTYNGYNAYGAISLDVQGANNGRGDLVFLNGGNSTSISERLRITGGGTVKINPAELQTTAGDKFAQIKGGGVINTTRHATGHFANTSTYRPHQYGYIGDYMHYGCNAVYFLAQTTTGNSGYSSHMFSWYDSGHWGHYGKFVLMCQESGYIGGMAHRYLSGTTVSTIFGFGNNGSVSTTSTTTGSGTHSGQSVTRYDCTVSHSGTYRTMRWYLGVLHGCLSGVTGNGKTQSQADTYANSNGSLLHLFGVSDSNLTMGPNYRTW